MIVNPSSVTSNKRRGAFIVFEGVDRCGKTTQVALLVKHLMSLGLAAVAMNFPDRSTMVGDLINQYLQSKNDLDDRAIHLLFSANRWEAVPKLEQWLLHEGTTVVCDRYAYSGVAFSSAKPSLDQELAWCQACDVGLPAPDAVIFLDLAPDDAERRGGYGGERYEMREMQTRVRQRFTELQRQDEQEQDKQRQVPWHIVNAAQSIEQVQEEINEIVLSTLDRMQQQNQGEVPPSLKRMWEGVIIKGDSNKEN